MGGVVDAIFGGGPDTPEVVKTDPKADQAKIDAEAATTANAATADRKRTARSQSLLASGAKGVTDTAQTSSALAYGKDKLGA